MQLPIACSIGQNFIDLMTHVMPFFLTPCMPLDLLYGGMLAHVHIAIMHFIYMIAKMIFFVLIGVFKGMELTYVRNIDEFSKCNTPGKHYT